MTTTAERLAAAMAESPANDLFDALDIPRLRGTFELSSPEIPVSLRLRTVFGNETASASLFVPADYSARVIDVRPSGAGILPSLVTSVPCGSELVVPLPFVDLGSGNAALTAGGALLPTISTITSPSTTAQRLMRFGFVTDPWPKTWLDAENGSRFLPTLTDLLGNAWARDLAALIATTAISQAAATAAYSSGSTTSLVAQAVARVAEGAFGGDLVLVASAGAMATLRKDAVAAGSTLEALVPDVAHYLTLPSALLPASGTVLVLSPRHFAMWHNEHDSPTLQFASCDQSDFLQGQLKAKIEQRIFVELVQTKAAATITAVPVVS